MSVDMRNGNPAINVKVHGAEMSADEWRSLASEFGWSPGELARFRAWADSPNLPDSDRDVWWEAACEDGWEQAWELLDIFNSDKVPGDQLVTIDCGGRSGGWLVVNNLPGFDSRYDEMNDEFDAWTEADWDRWYQFRDAVQVTALDTPYRFYWLVAANEWEAEKEWADQVEMAGVL